MSELLDRYRRCIDGFSARVDAAAGKWANASPCEGWTAADVVNHVTGNHRNLANAMAPGSAPAADAAITEPAGAFTEARDAVAKALEDPANLAKQIPGPFGPMPAEQLLGQIMAMDVLVHTWDLARAVGADEALPADLVEVSYGALKPLDAMIRQPGVFGAKVEPAREGVQAEFLAFLGRKA